MIESIASNARDAVGDGDGIQGRTIIESKTAYACHAVGDVERSEAGAALEGTPFNSCHTTGDSDGGKTRATREGGIVNARHAAGDDNGVNASAPVESITADTRHAFRDNQVLYLLIIIAIEMFCIIEGIGIGFYELYATPCSNVGNNHFLQARTIIESISTNARDAVRDGDGG
jgi:hypothetical protein